MQRYNFTEIDRQTALRMREMGKSWGTLARHFDCSEETIRRVIDPEYRRVRSERYRPVHDKIISNAGRFPPAEVERILRTIQPDTRTLQAKFMGDPIPGRSALDKKRASGALSTVNSQVFHTIHTTPTELLTSRASELARGHEQDQASI